MKAQSKIAFTLEVKTLNRNESIGMVNGRLRDKTLSPLKLTEKE